MNTEAAGDTAIEYRIDPFPSEAEMSALESAVWGRPGTGRAAVLARSLVHVGAYAGGALVGFVNVAWDGGVHALVFDTAVHPDFRWRGIGTRLVREAVDGARTRGAEWLHVDFEPHLAGFYRDCGFRPTEAGLIRLR